MSLAQKLIAAAGKNSRAGLLSESNLKLKEVVAATRVPLVNMMLSGDFNGGLIGGITQLIGDSRTFKTNFCLMLVKSFLDTYKDAVCVFFDSEFGAEKYFDVFGIDRARVIHVPFENLEELKFQTTQMIEKIAPEDKVIFFTDSVSQTASKKEVNDAKEGKAVGDLTRAREMNSFFRIITPMINLRRIPYLVINSFYDDMDNEYADPIVKGGKQIFLSSDTLLFVSRSQEKNDTTKELLGWTFKYKIMKSRFVKEKAVFPVTVMFNGGIDVNSGLLDIARAGGFITMPTNGWYTRTKVEGDKKWQAKQMDDEFWKPVLADPEFLEFGRRRYSLETGAMFEEVDEDGVIEKV